MPVFPDESAPIVRFVRKIRHFPGQNTVLLLSHDVNGLPVSLTSYANFVVNELFSVTIVNEMQVLLTTHESTNFSNLLFLLIRRERESTRLTLKAAFKAAGVEMTGSERSERSLMFCVGYIPNGKIFASIFMFAS